MNENTSNNSVLSELPGGFAIIPNALISFISDKACVVFLKIYQCQFMLENTCINGENWVQISNTYLVAALNKKHRNTTNEALEELLYLGIIERHSQSRKQVFYRINWDEIMFVCEVLCSVNSEGARRLFDMCVRTKNERMSKIKQEILQEIISSYPQEKIRTENERIIQDSYEKRTNPPTFVRKMNESTNIRTKNERIEKHSCDFRTNVEEDPKMPNNALISQENNDDEEKIRTENERIIQDSCDFRTNNAEIRSFSVHNIYIKEKEKKEYEEAKLPYIGGKKEKLLEYFSSRNLSLPGFDKILLESFLEKGLEEEDDDVVKSIKIVWGQLGYDEELPDNNFIDLGTFQNILFHSWEQLKQDFPDYSLSEEDIKNIFGFIVMEHEGENCLYIDPSKIQDIAAPNSQPIQKQSPKNSKYSDRTSRRLFIDCIGEIAEQDEQLLTSSEFVALLLIDYANEHSSAFSRELSKLAYEELLKEFSKNSGVPVEDIQFLFKDLPQKHKVKISPQQLLPEKFFQYNREHGEESRVEVMLQKKLEEA